MKNVESINNMLVECDTIEKTIKVHLGNQNLRK